MGNRQLQAHLTANEREFLYDQDERLMINMRQPQDIALWVACTGNWMASLEMAEAAAAQCPVETYPLQPAICAIA